MNSILLTGRTWRVVSVLLVALASSACEPPVTSTFVDGSVSGVSIPGALAVSTIDYGTFGDARATVWIGSRLQCRDFETREQRVNFGPSAKVSPDGGRAPLLILQNGVAYFDTGAGSSRMSGSANVTFFEKEGDALVGRFVANFSPDGGVVDGGTFSGDFIAPPCASADSGCEVAPVGTFGVIALALLWLRRTRLAR